MLSVLSFIIALRASALQVPTVGDAAKDLDFLMNLSDKDLAELESKVTIKEHKGVLQDGSSFLEKEGNPTAPSKEVEPEEDSEWKASKVDPLIQKMMKEAT